MGKDTESKIKQLKGSDIPKIRKWILKKKQKGICPICKNKITDPCLDHSHKKKIKGTGLIRGVLCRSCNVFIAKSENNCIRYGIKPKKLPKILRNMADYLEREHYPYIHPTEKRKPDLLKKSSFNKMVKKLEQSDYRGKLPEWPEPKGKKKTVKVTMTKKLESFYKKVNMKPEFYKRK